MTRTDIILSDLFRNTKRLRASSAASTQTTPVAESATGTEAKEIPPTARTNAVNGIISQSAAPTSPCRPVINEIGVIISKNR